MILKLGGITLEQLADGVEVDLAHVVELGVLGGVCLVHHRALHLPPLLLALGARRCVAAVREVGEARVETLLTELLADARLALLPPGPHLAPHLALPRVLAGAAAAPPTQSEAGVRAGCLLIGARNVPGVTVPALTIILDAALLLHDVIKI